MPVWARRSLRPHPGWRGFAVIGLDQVRTLAAFYGTGGLLCVLADVLPGWSGRDGARLAAVAAAALLAAAGLLLLRRRVRAWACHLLVALGSGLIAVAMTAAGGGAASASFGGFYVWVAVYGFTFFRTPAASAHVALALTCEVAAVRSLPSQGAGSVEVLLSVGTIVSTGVVVGLLMARIRRLADTDALTDTANRRTLERELPFVVARASRALSPLCVLALDLDGFKAVNDVLGHAEGDRLLTATAAAWSAVLREGDLLARTGGDEFVMVLPDCTPEAAAAVVDRVRQVTPAPLSTSVGLSMHAVGMSPQDLLRQADLALYEAKRARPDEALSASG